MSCDFCNEQEFEGRTVFEDDLVRAFLTNTPIVPGHALVIPKRHAATIYDLTPAEREALMFTAHKVAEALVLAFGAHGFNYAWNEGKEAGQSIPHLHMHIVPRTKNDAGIVGYEPRKFLYRPDSRAASSQEELLQIAALIKKSL